MESHNIRSLTGWPFGNDRNGCERTSETNPTKIAVGAGAVVTVKVWPPNFTSTLSVFVPPAFPSSTVKGRNPTAVTPLGRAALMPV